MTLNSESIRVRVHPYERHLVTLLAHEQASTISDTLRDLIRQEYIRRHGALPLRPVDDPEGYTPGRPRKEGMTE